MLKSKLSLSGAVAAVAVLSAFVTFDGTPAQAQTPLAIYSGGGTLAASVYRDLFNCWGSQGTASPTLGTMRNSRRGC